MTLFSKRKKKLNRFPDGFDQNSGPIVLLGFNKTGTTSLKHFFRENGFREIKHDNGQLPLAMIRNTASQNKVFEGYEDRYGVFCDLGFFGKNFCFECNQLFRTIDHQYPKTRFIYNHRPIEKWLDSRVNHRSQSDPIEGTLVELQMHFLGLRDINALREHWRNERQRFEQDIQNYFLDRDNLLIIDIEKDDVAAKISEFLAFTFKPETWKQHRKTEAAAGKQAR